MPRLLHPNTRRRLRRFRKMGRAKWSFRILLAVFVLSLCAAFIANDKPIMVKHDGETYFPILKFYPDDTFTGSGKQTRADYKELDASDEFDGSMVWPPIRYGPSESLASSEVAVENPVKVTIRQQSDAKAASFDLIKGNIIARSRGAADVFADVASDRDLRKKVLSDVVPLSADAAAAIADRFADKTSPATILPAGDNREISLNAYESRGRAPKSVRLTVRNKATAGDGGEATLSFDRDLTIKNDSPPTLWVQLSKEARDEITAATEEVLRTADVTPTSVTSDGKQYTVTFETEKVTFPYRPFSGHKLGLNEEGRDVFVQILYATRISLLFGFLLVVLTFVVGVIAGAIQGYFGGKTDMFGQRLTEIWQSLPFLLIMIMMSAAFGRGFFILAILYAAFQWIPISYYMRAEFLKLRKQPFVESARVMGLPRWKIMFKHILPNSLTPLITFLPFSLVGAIFALTSLDYLGFGLPAGTPSWGNLLSQGQTHPYAWWLVLFPAIALFIVSILCVFIGEGLRAAFDPRSESKIE